MLAFLGALLLALCNGQGRYAPDKVTNLPGLDFKTDYDQYSGYLNLSNGHHLHCTHNISVHSLCNHTLCMPSQIG